MNGIVDIIDGLFESLVLETPRPKPKPEEESEEMYGSAREFVDAYKETALMHEFDSSKIRACENLAKSVKGRFSDPGTVFYAAKAIMEIAGTMTYDTSVNKVQGIVSELLS